MREILFRGKRLDNGELVDGHLVRAVDYLDETEHCFIVADAERFPRNEFVGFHEVDTETVGQYTGLKDKRGKRIFEGDVVLIRFEGDAEPPIKPESWYETGKVIWHEQLHGWYVVFDSPDGIPIQEYDDCDDVFIIGNIYDNPELLEVAQRD